MSDVCTSRAPRKPRLHDTHFEAFVVNGGETLDWINAGPIDAPDRMPAGCMVSDGLHRIDQSYLWRIDAQETLDRMHAALAIFRASKAAEVRSSEAVGSAF